MANRPLVTTPASWFFPSMALGSIMTSFDVDNDVAIVGDETLAQYRIAPSLQ